MATYKAAMTVLGLHTGETFDSDDPGWDKYVKGGLLTVVEKEDKQTAEARRVFRGFDGD